MSWNYLPKHDRMPAPSEQAELEMSPAMHELARKKRVHKRAMSILGKCLFAAALSIEPENVPIGKVITSLSPLEVRASRAKTRAKMAQKDRALELL